MSITQAIILALIQGVTEFLPISSSAHLILPNVLLGWPDQGLAFDVAVHVGSLAAVVIYFRSDVLKLIRGWFYSLTPAGYCFAPASKGDNNPDGRLAWCILFATIPAGIAGLLFDDFVESHLRSAAVIAFTTIVFGLALWWADAHVSQKLRLQNITIRIAVVIGLAQALALVPGTSRSGITITAAILLGMGRVDAARFSFLFNNSASS